MRCDVSDPRFAAFFGDDAAKPAPAAGMEEV